MNEPDAPPPSGSPGQGTDTTTLPPERPDALAQAWEEVLAHWDDDALHARFVARCADQHELPFAGHCYRTTLEARPDEPQALRGKQRVLAQAMALLQLETKARRDWRDASKTIRAMSIIVIFSAIAVAMFFFLSQSPAR